jgi:hypothetical protein
MSTNNNQDNSNSLNFSKFSVNQDPNQENQEIRARPDTDTSSDMELEPSTCLSPRTTVSCHTSSSPQASTSMENMSKSTQNMSMDEFIKLRNKIAHLEKILASKKQMQGVVERPIRPESDQRRHIDISSTDTSGNPLPGGRISEGDPGITRSSPASKLKFPSTQQPEMAPSAGTTTFQSRSVTTKPNLKYFNVDKFVPDNAKIDKGFRKWLTKFLQAISFAQEHANETWNERLKIHLLESKVTGIAEHCTESHRHEYQGKTLEETIELLRKYMSSTITSETVTDFLNKCRKDNTKTWMEYMAKLLDIVNCKPGGLQNPENIREALRVFLRNLSRMLKMGYILGVVNANEGDPMVQF